MNVAAVRARRPPALLGLVFKALPLALLAGAVARALGRPVPLGWLAVLLVALLALVVLGVVSQASGVFARPILAVETPFPELALTFDDGPNPATTRALLDRLEARGHRATFFVIGENLRRHPELAAEMVRRGHALANHTWKHSSLTNLRSPRKLERELRGTDALIIQAGGRAPRFLRAPVGLLSPRLAKAARLAGLDLVAWTASARDGVAWRTAAEGVARLTPALRAGAILVLHDGARDQAHPPVAPEILDALLDPLDARQLRSVTLDRLLRL